MENECKLYLNFHYYGQDVSSVQSSEKKLVLLHKKIHVNCFATLPSLLIRLAKLSYRTDSKADIVSWKSTYSYEMKNFQIYSINYRTVY